jgi:uncharacterized membrane protein
VRGSDHPIRSELLSLHGIGKLSEQPRTSSMNAVLNDFRIALRQHFRQPAFALTVVCTLALAMGATTAVFVAPSTGLTAGQDVWITPTVVAATAALLVAVVMLAAWLPARRAARIEPALALKGS